MFYDVEHQRFGHKIKQMASDLKIHPCVRHAQLLFYTITIYVNCAAHCSKRKFRIIFIEGLTSLRSLPYISYRCNCAFF